MVLTLCSKTILINQLHAIQFRCKIGIQNREEYDKVNKILQ